MIFLEHISSACCSVIIKLFQNNKWVLYQALSLEPIYQMSAICLYYIYSHTRHTNALQGQLTPVDNSYILVELLRVCVLFHKSMKLSTQFVYTIKAIDWEPPRIWPLLTFVSNIIHKIDFFQINVKAGKLILTDEMKTKWWEKSRYLE